MNKLTVCSQRFLDRFCKYLLILLFFSSFALSAFYTVKYFPLDLKLVYTDTGEVNNHQRLAYEIYNWTEYGISLFGSVLCGIGLLGVAMISLYGVVCSFGLFSVPKDSLQGRKCLLIASIVGTMASFVLIMSFLLCGTHAWYSDSPMLYSLTPPWHIWLPLPAFLLLLFLSVLGKQDLVDIKKPVQAEKNTPITRIIFSILAVFCIMIAVLLLSGQYKIPATVSGQFASGRLSHGKVWALLGNHPNIISPLYSAIIVGNAFCALLLLFGAVLAVQEGFSKYHHRFRSLGIISVSGILGFAYLYFAFSVLPDGTDMIFNKITYFMPEFVVINLAVFAVAFVCYILYMLIKNRRIIFGRILNSKPIAAPDEPTLGAFSNRMRAVCAGIIVSFIAFAFANACGYYCYILKNNGEYYSIPEIRFFCEYVKKQNLNLSNGMYNGLFAVNIASTFTMLLGVFVSLYGLYKESKYVLPISGILGMIAFGAQILSLVFMPDIHGSGLNYTAIYAPGYYHYGGFLLYAIVFTIGIVWLRRKKVK